MISSSSVRAAVAFAVALTAAPIAAQNNARPTAAPAQPATEAAQVQRVRLALGHGQVEEARRLADAIAGSAGKNLGSALVDIFEGKDEDARTKLEPLALVNKAGDAAVELGLLEFRHGQRSQSYQRLNAIASIRTFTTPDDYFRLARAARGIREFLLANDAYNRIANEPRADIQTEWGDVFLERHANGEAVT